MAGYRSITEAVGDTPLVELTRYEREHALKSKIFAKLEYFNPTGSAKDRVALAMIEDAEWLKKLKKGATIIAVASGSMGISLAAIGAAKGYRVILIMPGVICVDRYRMETYGAEILTAEDGEGAMKTAEALHGEIADSILLDVTANPANARIHRRRTAPEIWRDTGGRVDVFVAGFDTGGTLAGVGEYLREMDPDVRIVAAELANRAKRCIELCDEVVSVTEEEALAARIELGKEGILAGISSGMVLAAAVKLAERKENTGKRIVVLFPDGER